MDLPAFTETQCNIIHSQLDQRIFLSGQAGCGKTTIAVARLDFLIHEGAPQQDILIFVPQRSLANPFYQYLNHPNLPAGGTVTILTLGGLARRMVDLFWPLISTDAGFSSPELSPTFLTLETTQYFMELVVQPLLDEGYFESINIERNRLYSQIIDNLNKACVVGFPIEEIGLRLQDAAAKDSAQKIAFEQAQECAIQFRKFCLQNRLLDYSLQVDLLVKNIWTSELGQSYLRKRYQHLIYDNVEEDVPIAHDLIKKWLPSIKSALIINDLDGGFRVFLGADPKSASNISSYCEVNFNLEKIFVVSPEISELQNVLSDSILRTSAIKTSSAVLNKFTFFSHQYYPEMIRSVCETVSKLVFEESINPEDIAILAPYISDALRFSLMTNLEKHNIPAFSERPSRSLVEEPATQCLLTFARLAHPEWELFCSQLELRQALIVAIKDIDLIRADLCSKTLYFEKQAEKGLGSFDQLRPEMQERISFSTGEKLEMIRRWLLNYQSQKSSPLFVFLSRIFGELFSQPTFGLHEDFDAAATTAHLIESARKFRLVMSTLSNFDEMSNGREYIQTLQKGLIAAQYFSPTEKNSEKGVLITPAFTFLMRNQAVKYQFWLDVGSTGWWERINQPLTNPHMLNRNWIVGTEWTDAHEFDFNQRTMAKLVRGLLKHCTHHLFLFMTKMNERGNDQRGPLLQAFQYIYKQSAKNLSNKNV